MVFFTVLPLVASPRRYTVFRNVFAQLVKDPAVGEPLNYCQLCIVSHLEQDVLIYCREFSGQGLPKGSSSPSSRGNGHCYLTHSRCSYCACTSLLGTSGSHVSFNSCRVVLT